MFNKLKILSKMKKIKLFALAAFAMLSTNVMADVTTYGNAGTSVFAFKWTQVTNDAGTEVKSRTATITGFVSGMTDEQMAAVLIPETVKEGTGEGRVFKVVGIEPDAFAGKPVKSISFFEKEYDEDGNLVKGITSIGAGAFAGTGIQKLDLTNTEIAAIGNYFGTKVAAVPAQDKYNTTLKEIILPNCWTSIDAGAFENCTKLATVNFGKAKKSITSQTIGANAFAGAAITALDFTGTKVTTVPATLMTGGTDRPAAYTANSTLKTVTLTSSFAVSATGLNGAFKNFTALTTVTGLEDTKIVVLKASEFEGCTALASINTKKIATFNASCFKNCAALQSIDLSACTGTLGASAFEGAGLTSVTIPAVKGFTTIDEKAFWECAALATVTIGVAAANGDGLTKDKTNITTINGSAFGYTAIEAFTLPAANTDGFTIAEKAFVGCDALKDFTYAPATITTANAQKINGGAFLRCSGVAFHTSTKFIEYWRSGTDYATETAKYYNGPTNTTFDEDVSGNYIELKGTQYKSNSKKYYVKWAGAVKTTDPYDTPQGIKIKKGDAKVYSAFVDADHSTINVCAYPAIGGYYIVKAGAVALIVSENETLKVEKTTADGTSWQTSNTACGTYTVGTEGKIYNALRFTTAATTRATLESGVPDGYYMYGWMNKAEACGFQMIGSGKDIPEATLFMWAKPADGGRVTIKWFDEDGNLESEATAINSVKAAAEAEGARYNVAGQKVSASYKGLVIKDGKKYMQK